jgi:hypothetical protein
MMWLGQKAVPGGVGIRVGGEVDDGIDAAANVPQARQVRQVRQDHLPEVADDVEPLGRLIASDHQAQLVLLTSMRREGRADGAGRAGDEDGSSAASA